MAATVLITGCSSGLGAASARLFAERGWNVIATMRDVAAGAELVGLDNVLPVRLDVQDRRSIETAVATGIERFSRIDVLINNAGFGLHGVFESTPREKVLEQFEVNVFGVMDVTRTILPHFRANKAGSIVNVSSGAGVFTLPMLSLYCASKFALEGFSEALAYELAPLGITVKIVEPGGVLDTNFRLRSGHEAGKIDTPIDYDGFVEATKKVFERLRGARLSSQDDVAELIFQATSDGTDRLRYVVTEDIKPLVTARRESGEEAYIKLMRDQFMGASTSTIP